MFYWDLCGRRSLKTQTHPMRITADAITDRAKQLRDFYMHVGAGTGLCQMNILQPTVHFDVFDAEKTFEQNVFLLGGKPVMTQSGDKATVEVGGPSLTGGLSNLRFRNPRQDAESVTKVSLTQRRRPGNTALRVTDLEGASQKRHESVPEVSEIDF